MSPVRTFRFPGALLNRLLLAVLAASTLAVWPASAQTPFLVSDVNSTAPSPRGSDPNSFLQIGDTLYFFATTTATGAELWKYRDGTASTVSDVSPDTYAAFPFNPRLVHLGGGVMVFRSANRLWRSDGTAAGTSQILNIIPYGTAQVVWNNKLYFFASDGTHGTEPWVTDGTAAGTQLLGDLSNSIQSSKGTQFGVAGDKLLIFTDNTLWASDGTTAGTTQIGTPRTPAGGATIGSTFFFTAIGNTTGRELWKTDGTAAGTQLVTDLRPGTASAFLANTVLGVVGSTLYFVASADGAHADLWKSDGTTAGTQYVQMLMHDEPALRVWRMITAGNALYIESDDGVTRVDFGTSTTTLLDTQAYGVQSAGGSKVYYFRHVSGNPAELWSTDGLNQTLVTKLPSENGSGTYDFTGGKLYFSCENTSASTGYEPWVSEGTAATTHALLNLNPELAESSDPLDLTASGNLLFFTADDGLAGRQLWRTDGTSTGTQRLTNDAEQPDLELFTGWRGSLYYKRNTYTEFWRSDGTVATTALVKNFAQGYNTPLLSEIFAASSSLFLNADDGAGRTVWSSDGTAAGTVSLTAGLPPYGGPEYPRGFAELAGRVYTTGRTNTGDGIWITQGTQATTKLIGTVDTGGGDTSRPVAAAGSIFFMAPERNTGAELWRTDGSNGGETLVRDIVPGEVGSSPDKLTAAGPYLYFVADDGTNGKELWRSDGTEAGTILLKDIAAGAATSEPDKLTAAAGLLYFTANDGTNGVELWRSNGTPEGTVLVADLRAGSASSSPASLVYANGTLWFSADDGIAGIELWRLDGATPSMVADLVPGPASSWPSEMVQVGQTLYFSAESSLGRELWGVALTGATFTVSDVRLPEGSGGTLTVRMTVTRSSTAGAATVAFTTMNGSAEAGTDYVARSGTLTFSAGQAFQFVDVTVNSDTAIEPNEVFYLALSTPSAGTSLARNLGSIIIEDDDHRAELSIVSVQDSTLSEFADRHFRITNAGPSIATDVTIRVSESPRNMTLNVSQKCTSNSQPVPCNLGTLRVGASLDVFIEHAEVKGFVSPTAIPGSTVAASVSAAEKDTNAVDNFVSNLMSRNGALMLPAALIVGATPTMTFMLPSPATRDTQISFFSSRANVVITPSMPVIATGARSVTVSINPGTQTGPVLLQAFDRESGWEFASLTAYVVNPLSLINQDVAIVADGSSVIYGQAGTVTVEVAAVRHGDSARPTGVVSLTETSTGAVVQQSLDAAGKTVFTRSNLTPGTKSYTVSYAGSTSFNALAGAPATITVSGYPTTVTLEAPPMICAGTTPPIYIYVRTSHVTTAPTGSVTIQLSNELVATLPLAATGVPGESRALLQRTFATNEGYLFALYQPTGTFANSSASQSILTGPCAPLNVRATATSTSSITVTWTGNGAAYYEVRRSYNLGNWQTVSTTQATSLVDTNGIAPNTSYLYYVRAMDATGQTIAYGAADLATTILFADDPLVARSTRGRATHILQLRTAINAMRSLGTDVTSTPVTPLPVGTKIKASDITALRDDITNLRRALGLPTITWTDAVPKTMKAIHVQELRDAVR
jgi:ELWxxDGT repeat protein